MILSVADDRVTSKVVLLLWRNLRFCSALNNWCEFARFPLSHIFSSQTHFHVEELSVANLFSALD